MSESEPFQIASFPNYQNPYLDLFYGALEPYGVEHVGHIQFSFEWLRKYGNQINALHIHWPEKIWRSDSRWKSIRSLVFLWQFLETAEEIGLQRIWTVHNLEPHHNPDWIDWIGHQILAYQSDLLICHSEWAADKVQQKYQVDGTVTVMYHGNFKPAYPKPRSRRSILDGYELDASPPIVGLVGILRPYKGIDIACAAAKKLEGNAQLLIAGRIHPTLDEEQLRRQVASSPNIELIPGRLSEQEFADLISVTELVLLPYEHVTSSGLLLAAWSFGRSVVASDLPFFREMYERDKGAIRLFEATNRVDLANTINEHLKVISEVRNSSAESAAQRYPWNSCIQSVIPHLNLLG